MHVRPQILILSLLPRPKPSSNHQRSPRLRIPLLPLQRLFQIRSRLLRLPTQQPRHPARRQQMRGRQRQRRVTDLLRIERMRVRVAVFACDEPDGGFDKLQEEIIFGPVFAPVEFFFG